MGELQKMKISLLVEQIRFIRPLPCFFPFYFLNQRFRRIPETDRGPKNTGRKKEEKTKTV